MEQKHRERIRSQHPQRSRECHFQVLEIEDKFRAMDPRLIKELKEAIDPIIEENSETNLE
ncbi:MAG: hypothetical protein ACSHYB_19145 [Roseibacillus sp.]